MFLSEEEDRYHRNAAYAAYTEAVKDAHKILSDSVTCYFEEHRELYDAEIVVMPKTFRPLKDYERSLKIQNLTLRLALRAAGLSDTKVANNIGEPVHANGHGTVPAVLTLPPA
jgi:hypothetical protein